MLVQFSNALLFTILATVGPTANGEVVVNVSNHNSDTLHEITVSPGDRFEIDLRWGSDDGMGLIGMRLRASASEIFEVIDGAWSDPWIGRVPVGGIDPFSDGFSGGLPLNGPGSGPVLATMRISVNDEASPGTYTLNACDIGRCFVHPSCMAG